MKTKQWKRIERLASLDAFVLWLLESPEDLRWKRGDACACPLHDFIEDATGHSLNANSPELSEHWSERESQSWPTPWWMTWIIRSVDHAGDGLITKDELLFLTLLMGRRDFSSPVLSAEEMEVDLP